MGFCELSAWAGLQLQSSQALDSIPSTAKENKKKRMISEEITSPEY
jgi:hypothetical protein